MIRHITKEDDSPPKGCDSGMRMQSKCLSSNTVGGAGSKHAPDRDPDTVMLQTVTITYRFGTQPVNPGSLWCLAQWSLESPLFG